MSEPDPTPESPNRQTTRLRVLGVPVDGVTWDGLLDLIGGWVAAGDRLHQICTVGPEFIMIAQEDSTFRRVLQTADLCVADGVGLLWAARYLARPLPDRITGSDGVPRIAQAAAREGWRLFLLGAAPGVAVETAARLEAAYPGLQVVGTFAGSPSPTEEDSIVTRINDSGADILFVAYGAPRQDLWIARNAARLQVAVAMGVGGTFDFITGRVPRAPRWVQQVGLEWVYRLYREPWRWRRMLRLPRFVWAVIRHRHEPVRGESGLA